MKKIEEFGREGLVIPYGIAKGLWLWTTKGMRLRSRFMVLLREQLSKVGNVGVNYTLSKRPLKEYADLYREKFEDYDNIPIYDSINGKEIFITDMLPYNLKKLSNSDNDFLMTNYSVVRLMKGKLEKLYTEDLITIFQINAKCPQSEFKEFQRKFFEAWFSFFKDINLNVRFVEYQFQKNYSQRLGFFCAVNASSTIEALVQFGHLDNVLLNKFNVECNSAYFDVGGSQRMFSVWYDNNSDEYALYLPIKLRDYDIYFISKEEHMNSDFIKILKASELRIYFSNKLGKIKMRKHKRKAVEIGACVMVILRKENNRFFLQCLTRSHESDIINNIGQFELLQKLVNNEDAYFYNKADLVYENKKEKAGLRVREKADCGTVKFHGFD